ncbi:MAG: hypothetical protein AUK48_01685 [Oscillatoriales cyanobacterium CG2_30_44_21]|nr:MAG: hypothetical protein AUK48_01685 [Oscillatoriales cyanobacterium CG2_30_44_21]
MPIHQPQKIDPEQIYPCPCPRRRGKLKPLALTDAFGCDRCSLLFELESDGYSLLQIGGLDHLQKHRWQWSGKWRSLREYRAYSLPELASMYLMVCFFLILAILWLANLKAILGIPLIILLFTFVGLLIWRLILLYRRDL